VPRLKIYTPFDIIVVSLRNLVFFNQLHTLLAMIFQQSSQ